MTKFFLLSCSCGSEFNSGHIFKKTFGKTHFGAPVMNIKDGVLWKGHSFFLIPLFIFKSCCLLMFSVERKRGFFRIQNPRDRFSLFLGPNLCHF